MFVYVLFTLKAFEFTAANSFSPYELGEFLKRVELRAKIEVMKKGIFLITNINKDFALELKQNLTEDELANFLAQHINEMILHDLPKLIQLLYRVDISEKNMKQMRHHN